MKRVVLFVAAFVFFLCSANAQIGKSIYEKYSTMEGVEAEYVAPFKLILGLLLAPDLLEGIFESDLSLEEWGEVLRSMRGIYALDVTDTFVIYFLDKDVSKAVKEGELELLMESRSEGNISRVYASSEGDKATGIVIYAIEPGESSFVSIDFHLDLSRLKALLAS